jgi:hypothetical protein
VNEVNSAGVMSERLSEMKWQNMEWYHTTSPKKKPKTVPLAGKFMGTVFWDSEGCKVVDILEKMVNDQRSSLRSDAQQTSSCASWKKSEEENCHPSRWQREAPHCTSDLADDSNERLGTALPPTLQSGLAHSDYHLFGPLKNHLMVHHYETGEAVQAPVRSWLRGAGTVFHRRGIFKIVQH